MTFPKIKFSLGGFFRPRKTKNESAQSLRDVRKDWQIACFVFLISVLISIVGSIVVYRRVNSGEIFLSDKKEQVSRRTLDRFELEKTILFFEKKHERFEMLRRRPLSTVDPFIPKPVPKKE